MKKIICHGFIDIPDQVIKNANEIRFENYKVNTPTKFQIRNLNNGDVVLMQRIADKVKIDVNKLDFVYFSVCKGAEPHVDELDPNMFESRTFVIPIVLPTGKSVITAENESIEVKLNHIYEFNHEKVHALFREKVHSMELEDTNSGCTVIMVAVKKIKF